MIFILEIKIVCRKATVKYLTVKYRQQEERERDKIDVSFMSVWVYENFPETKKHIDSYMVEICWKKIVEVD